VLKQETGRRPVVAVAGCVAQQEGDSLLRRSNGHMIDVVMGTQRLKMLPQLAEGDANKVFVVPSEFAEAFGGIGEALKGRLDAGPRPPGRPPPAPADGHED